MEAKLVVVGGESQILQYELELPVVIGRSRSTDVTLTHPLVSRHHCEVFEADGVLMVRDLGSLNGTYIGETRITEQAAPVKPGELFTVGPVTFRAVYRAADRRLNSGGWEAQGPTIDAPLPNKLDNLRDTALRPKRPGDSDL